MINAPRGALQDRAADRARTFVTLDGLRGVAALMIAVRHAPSLWPAGHPTGLLYESYLSVDFFFVLSGFVLAYAYGDRLRSGMSATAFMSARLVRLYPLYLLALTLAVAAAVDGLTHGASPPVIALNAMIALLFLPTPFSRDLLFPLNAPAWSLFFELAANFAFGLAGRRLDTRVLVAIVTTAGLVLLASVWRGWLGFGSGWGGVMDAGSEWASIGGGVARVAYSFFAGVLAFRLWRARPGKRGLPPVVLAAILCLTLASCPPAKYQAAFDLVATLFVFPALVFLGASSVPGEKAARVFARLGAVSYAVYVLQAPFFDLARIFAAHAYGFRPDQISLPLAAAGVVLLASIAALADRFYDRPVRRRLTAMLKTARRAAPAVGAAAPGPTGAIKRRPRASAAP